MDQLDLYREQPRVALKNWAKHKYCLSFLGTFWKSHQNHTLGLKILCGAFDLLFDAHISVVTYTYCGKPVCIPRQKYDILVCKRALQYI